VFDPAAKFLSKSGTSISGQGIKSGLAGIAGAAGANYEGNSIMNQQATNDQAKQQDAARGVIFAGQGGLGAVNAAGLGPLGSLGSIGRATGGITALAHGGQVALGDGAYIIPADVVSALGNGSSKAGADYLRRLMIEVRKEAVHLQGMGAAKKHVS
jgi:hypothetical protein